LLTPWKPAKDSANEAVATVLHDHLIDDQHFVDADAPSDVPAGKQPLYESCRGRGGVYFRPSTIAGDGYRVRAELRFEKVGDYELDNLDSLKNRYPVRPACHSAKLRMWRRASMRGYMKWTNEAVAHWPAFLADFRRHHRAAHVYFVHEGGAATQHALADVFDPGTPAHVTRFKGIVEKNVQASGRPAIVSDLTKLDLSRDHVWPWFNQDDFGWPWESPAGLASGDVFDNWLNGDVFDGTWRAYRDGLLLALLKQVEAKGQLRGHLFVEFKSSPTVDLREYTCDLDTCKQKYWYLHKGGGPDVAENKSCPTGCGGTLHRATDFEGHYLCGTCGAVEDAANDNVNGNAFAGQNCNSCPTGVINPSGAPTPAADGDSFSYNDGMPLPAVGIALGATWLFTSSDAETWVHEVGHHRHLEHSASAPGARASTHDAQANTHEAWPAAIAAADDKQWDRDCIMSYTSASATDVLCLCGKCLLVQRGWKVEALGGPGSDKAEPAP
jgi:hypothetical protein